MRTGRVAEADRVTIHTDGSASLKDRTGGWAIRAEYEGEVGERAGYLNPATNITAELEAILHALEFVNPEPRRKVLIITDSEFSIKALTLWMVTWEASGWVTAAGTPVQNKALLLRIKAAWGYHAAAGGMVEFRFVKGHSGDPGNERCDFLAGQARKRITYMGEFEWKKEDAKFAFCAKCAAYPTDKCPHDSPRASSRKTVTASYQSPRSARCSASVSTGNTPGKAPSPRSASHRQASVSGKASPVNARGRSCAGKVSLPPQKSTGTKRPRGSVSA